MQFYHPGKKCGNFCLVCKKVESTCMCLVGLAVHIVIRVLSPGEILTDSTFKIIAAVYHFRDTVILIDVTDRSRTVWLWLDLRMKLHIVRRFLSSPVQSILMSRARRRVFFVTQLICSCTHFRCFRRFPLISKDQKEYMSLDARKPVFGVSDQVRHKPACTRSEKS